MNKKGSMELSVNSIVILVIAIVMLGLILGFVKSKFGDISKNVEIEEPEPAQATASDTLTLSRTLVVLSPGEKAALRLSYYDNAATGTSFTPSMICSPTAGAPSGEGLAKVSIAGGAESYSLRITAGITKELYICTVTLGNANKDITVKVV